MAVSEVAVQQNPISLDHGATFVNRLCIGAVCLTMCTVLPRAVDGQAITSTTSELAASNRATRIVTDTLIRTLSVEISAAQARRSLAAYLLDLPSDSVLVQWSLVRRILSDTLRAREATEADTSSQTLWIVVRAATSSALTLSVLSGAKWKCGSEWHGGSSAREIFIPFDQSAAPPMVLRQQFSHSLPCPSRGARPQGKMGLAAA